MKIAILTRPENRSPKILAESLRSQLGAVNIDAEVFYKINLLNNLVSFKDSEVNFHFWLKNKIIGYFKWLSLLKVLRKYDAIVISEFIPNGFLRRLYNIEKFKKLVKVPVLFYEVYYLGNAPTQVNLLKNQKGDGLFEKYDFHLSVSDLTEIKVPISMNWFPIGIYAKSWNLLPIPKKEIIAIIDFAHPGNEEYRKIQIRALQQFGIRYISLEKEYTVEEIRGIYQNGAIYFMQSSEAFGLPILECLCCGIQIFTPSSSWPMSWRLDENPTPHGIGKLPSCFTIYQDEEQLVKELRMYKEKFHPLKTAQNVFHTFLQHYPFFYYGNVNELNRVIETIKGDHQKSPIGK